LERFTIEDMTVIDAGSSKSLTARLGVRWSRTQRYQEQISTGWLALDLLSTHGSDGSTMFSAKGGNPDVFFTDPLPGKRLKLSTGVTGHLSQKTKLDLHLSAENSIDGARMSNVGVTASLRMVF
jgi:outer membrane autotransporter protein